MSRGLYYYTFMSFVLKNARAIYQKMVNYMFALHIGKNMEVYLDDMLVKSIKVDHHETNLNEEF